MSYVLTDNSFYIGKGYKARPAAILGKENAFVFNTRLAAEAYLRSIPDALKEYNWSVCLFEKERESSMAESKKFGNTTKTTLLEDEGFNACEFFTNVIQVMSQIDRYVANMINNEQIADMKILDVRHYIRDNDHRLNAVQMQRLGYYLQDLEKERYQYKANRLIASMFANDLEALKDINNIPKINDILTSQYRPKILDDNDIDYIINKKKDEVYIA